MYNNNSGIALATALFAGVASVHAQSTYVRPSYEFPTGSSTGPASIQVGVTPFFFTPLLGLAAGHDDNVFYSNVNEKSSTLYIASPSFRLDSRDENKAFTLGYGAQIGRYAQSQDDDYVDQNLNAGFDIALDRRNFLGVGYRYVRSHDPRGSTDRPISGSPDKYKLSTPSINYVFGSRGAQGRVEVYASEADRRYLNNRSTTESADRKSTELGGAFYWRVAPRTHVLAEARQADIRYRTNTQFNSEEDRYYAGVTWEATAATSGTLKAGRLRKKFDSGLSTDSTSSWEAIVSWAPRTYSKFDVFSARTTNESTGLGSYILTSVTGVTWTHAWTSYLSTGVEGRYTKDEYQNFDRTDDTKMLGLRVGYKFRRWLTLGAEYTYTQRDSNVGTFEYDRNFYLLTATASM
jgi:polysaccharide biosynthesis protein VpsM